MIIATKITKPQKYLTFKIVRQSQTKIKLLRPSYRIKTKQESYQEIVEI